MLGNALQALARPLLVRQQAFETVRDAIITGRLAPGTRLIERELCEALGVSRASVREMIRRLEAERLISMKPRHGPTVITLTAKQAAEIYEIRGMIESLLFRRFTETATDAQIETLFAIFAEVKVVAAAEAIPEIVAAISRFNAHLVAVVDHSLAHDLLDQLNARIAWLRVKAMAEPGRIAASIAELDGVIAAVRARDADRAAAEITASVGNACAAAIAHLPPADETKRTRTRAGSERRAPKPRAKTKAGAEAASSVRKALETG